MPVMVTRSTDVLLPAARDSRAAAPASTKLLPRSSTWMVARRAAGGASAPPCTQQQPDAGCLLTRRGGARRGAPPAAAGRIFSYLAPTPAARQDHTAQAGAEARVWSPVPGWLPCVPPPPVVVASSSAARRARSSRKVLTTSSARARRKEHNFFGCLPGWRAFVPSWPRYNKQHSSGSLLLVAPW